MSKKHCSRCGQKSETKYNPYNVTFKNYHFGRYEKGGEGFFCLKCAEFFVKVYNKSKGGHWEIEKPSQKEIEVSNG